VSFEVVISFENEGSAYDCETALATYRQNASDPPWPTPGLYDTLQQSDTIEMRGAPTVEIHLTVDGCAVASRTKGVTVIVKDYATDPECCTEPVPAARVKTEPETGYEYIETIFNDDQPEGEK
jgi:hypothetical protein